MKLFVTGDNHFGRKFDKYPAIKDRLIESRYTCFEQMIKTAENEKCEFFVITGDLFDNNYSITRKDIKRVVDILGGFNRTVLVLPGNHDFYSGNDELWKSFMNEAGMYNNIILMNEYRVYELESKDGYIDFYPAYCNSKHSDTNRLGWIKEYDGINKDRFSVGIAHGALEGVAIDTEGQYFPMSKMELDSIPMDLWLIGHAHVPYPAMNIDEESSSYNIFNAGTHEQLDPHNRTAGNAFIISLEDNNGIRKVLSKRVETGNIRYFDETITFDATNERGLEEVITDTVKAYPDNSIVRITLSGSISQDEYSDKEAVYEKVLGRFMDHTIYDDDLGERITAEKIENEFSEIGFAANFLKELLNDPIELQMAYDVVKSVKG